MVTQGWVGADDKDRLLAGTDAGELIPTEGLEAKPPIQLGCALRTLSCFGKVRLPCWQRLTGYEQSSVSMSPAARQSRCAVTHRHARQACPG